MAVREKRGELLKLPSSIVITVGVHAAEGAELHTDATFESDGAISPGEALTVADIGSMMEFGHPNYPEPGTYPPRPFIRGWFDSSQAFISETLRAQFAAVIAGKRTAEQAAERCALAFEGDVKQRISRRGDGSYPGNADSTIRAKGSSVPLINRGQLRNAVRGKAEVK